MIERVEAPECGNPYDGGPLTSEEQAWMLNRADEIYRCSGQSYIAVLSNLGDAWVGQPTVPGPHACESFAVPAYRWTDSRWTHVAHHRATEGYCAECADVLAALRRGDV